MKKLLILTMLLCVMISAGATGVGFYPDASEGDAGGISVSLSSDGTVVTVTTTAAGQFAGLTDGDKSKISVANRTLVIVGPVNNSDIVEANSLMEKTWNYFKVDLTNAVPMLEDGTVAIGDAVYTVINGVSGAVHRVVFPKGSPFPNEKDMNNTTGQDNAEYVFNKWAELFYIMVPPINPSNPTYVFVCTPEKKNPANKVTSIPEAEVEGAGNFSLAGNINDELGAWIEKKDNVKLYNPSDFHDSGELSVIIPVGNTLEETLTADFLAGNGFSSVSDITYLIIKSGEINQADLEYIGNNMPLLEKLNVRYVTYSGELNFYEAFTSDADGDGNREPKLQNFKGLYFPDAMDELPDRFFNNALNKLYAINKNVVYVWSQRGEDGNGPKLDMSMMSAYLGNEDMEVVVFNKIKPEDVNVLANSFVTSKAFNFYNATFIDESGSEVVGADDITKFLDNLIDNGDVKGGNSVLYPKGTTLATLKLTKGQHVCNEYVIDDATKTLFVICRDGERLGLGFEKYENKDIETVAIISGVNYNTDETVRWGNFLKSLEGLKYARILDLSMIGDLDESLEMKSDEELSKFQQVGTTGSIVAVKLPASCPIHDNWYRENNASVPVVMRTHGLDNFGSDNVSVWQGVEGADMLICEMFVNKPGYLKEISGGINGVIRKDVKMLRLRGSMSEGSDAFAALNGCKMKYVNFAGLTTYPSDFTAFSSENVEYIALPNGCTIEDQIVMKNNCPNLKAVGLLEKADTEGKNDYRFRYRSFKPGSACNVITMLVDPGVPSAAPIMSGQDEDEVSGQADDVINRLEYNITEVMMKGYLNMYDISNNSNYYDEDTGHYADKQASKDGALASFNVKNRNGEADTDNKYIANVNSTINLVKADFTYALFADVDDNGEFKEEHSEDLRLSAAATFENCEEILLPVDHRQTTIPEMAFYNNFKNLKTLCIPGNIKVIKEGAFLLFSGLPHITTTGVDDEGNGDYSSESIVDNGPLTVTLPAGLKEIETKAFHFNTKITDVYVLAEEAPKCAKDAFSSEAYTGNNSFFGTPVRRESYVNPTEGNNSYAVLHFPSTVTETQAAKYTDITRVYSLSDTQGDTDGNGNIKMWPAQADWNLASVLAITGYTWNALDSDNNKWNYAFTPFDEDGNLEEGFLNALNKDASEHTFDTDYTGWHQFVLANTVYMENPELDMRNYSKFKTNDWYTICVPYNLRKSDLLKIFGAATDENGTVVVDGKEYTEDKYPEVCTLVGVERNMKAETITLHMSRDLVQTDFEMNENRTGATYKSYSDDDPIVIKEGFPYLIHPYLPADKLALASAGKYIVGIQEREDDNHVTGGESGIRIPVTDHIVTAIDEKGNALDKDESNTWKYQFVGCYADKEIPMYSYFFGLSKSMQKNIWFYLNVDRTITWGQYSALIAANATCSIKYPSAAEAKEGQNPEMTFKGNSDDLIANAAGAKYNMVFGIDGSETTGISDINNADESADGVSSNGRVYNLSGLYVGDSLNGLAKGVYIVNGKKYVVE